MGDLSDVVVPPHRLECRVKMIQFVTNIVIVRPFEGHF